MAGSGWTSSSSSRPSGQRATAWPTWCCPWTSKSACVVPAPQVVGARPGPPHRRGAVVSGVRTSGQERRRARRGRAHPATRRQRSGGVVGLVHVFACRRAARRGSRRCRAGRGGRRRATAGAVGRHQAQEAAVHRWDAEGVRARPRPLDPALADDGVPEFIEIMIGSDLDALPRRRHPVRHRHRCELASRRHASRLVGRVLPRGGAAGDRLRPCVHAVPSPARPRLAVEGDPTAGGRAPLAGRHVVTELTFLGTGNFLAPPGRYWNSFVMDDSVLVEPSPTALPHLRRCGFTAEPSRWSWSRTSTPTTASAGPSSSRRRPNGGGGRTLHVVGPPGIEAHLENMNEAGAVRSVTEMARPTWTCASSRSTEPGRKQVHCVSGPLRSCTCRTCAASAICSTGPGRPSPTRATPPLATGLSELARAADVLVVECNGRHAPPGVAAEPHGRGLHPGAPGRPPGRPAGPHPSGRAGRHRFAARA